jgi:hypothetical protein
VGVVLLEPYRGSQSETLKALQELLTEALKPNGAVGIVCILQRPGRDWSVIIAGEPRNNPIEAAFMNSVCDVLKGDLLEIIRGEKRR